MTHCKDCKFWQEDGEFAGVGACFNEEVLSLIILGNCDMFLLDGDFGCVFGEPQ